MLLLFIWQSSPEGVRLARDIGVYTAVLLSRDKSLTWSSLSLTDSGRRRGLGLVCFSILHHPALSYL